MAQSAPPPGPLRKLPIGGTVHQAYAILFAALPQLAKAIVAPGLLSLGLTLVSFRLFPIDLADRGGVPRSTPGIGPLVLWLLALVPLVLFAVGWHRFVLLGPTAAPVTWLPRWRRRHLRYLGYYLLVMVIAYLTATLLGAALMVLLWAGAPPGAGGAEVSPGRALAGIAGTIALFFLIAYAWLRLSFLFPAIAVDEAYGLRHAWRHTRGQALRLFAALVLATIPVLIAEWLLLALLFDGGQAGQAPVVWMLSASVLGFVAYGLYVTLISVAFRTCTGWVPPGRMPESSGAEQR